jgi:hypothetical protein
MRNPDGSIMYKDVFRPWKLIGGLLALFSITFTLPMLFYMIFCAVEDHNPFSYCYDYEPTEPIWRVVDKPYMEHMFGR